MEVDTDWAARGAPCEAEPGIKPVSENIIQKPKE